VLQCVGGKFSIELAGKNWRNTVRWLGHWKATSGPCRQIDRRFDRIGDFALQDNLDAAAMPFRNSEIATVDPLRVLLPQLLAGDPRVIAQFVRATAPAVLRVVRQILGGQHPDVPDVVQEATFACIDALGRFRGDSSVLHFVCRVAALTAMNARRRWQLRDRYAADVSSFEELESSELSPFGHAVAARRRMAFRQLLDELPAPQAEALVLHSVLGWTVDEAAEATGVPSNTVRSRMIAARSALLKKLAENPELRELLQGVS
jgi:RNA polymerase sigma-70 factor (ECF subfamily)